MMTEKLPNDLMFLIFSFLQLKDLRNLALSCKKFSEMCKNEKLWRIKFNNTPLEKRNLLGEEHKQLSFLEKCKLLINPNFLCFRQIQPNNPFANPFPPSRQPMGMPHRMAYNPPPMRMPHNPHMRIAYNPPPMRIPHNPPPMRMPHNPHMRIAYNPPPMRMPHNPHMRIAQPQRMIHIPMMRHQPQRMIHNPMMRHQPQRMIHNPMMRQPMHQSRQVISPQVYSPAMKSMNEEKPDICWIF
jgi:hypothetical protein